MKILIVAQNASHKFGGEAFLPVKYFEKLRGRGCSVKLIAHERNRADLQETLAPFLEDVHFVPDTLLHRAVWRAGAVLPRLVQEVVAANLLNVVNEVHQARIIRGLVRQGAVEIIHQPIPVSPLAPSTLYGFGVPVVIGPMNGGMNYPPGYEEYEPRSARLFVGLSRKMAWALNRLMPGKRRAAALLVANERTRRALPFPDHPNVLELVENGVDLETWRRAEGGRAEGRAGPETGPSLGLNLGPSLKLVFMGRLIALKGVDITLKAVALAREAGAEVALDILGDGPERGRLEAEARALGLGEAVRFLGFRAQGDCVEVLAQADALILNSLRECGGAVVLEAMSLGLPVIASDWGGPADYLDPSCGILASPAPKPDFPQRLADAILLLARSPETRREMGENGLRKVRSRFDWDKKIDAILEIYRAAAGKGVVK